LSKEDILAILQASRELGPTYDEHTADQIMELVRQPSVSSKPWQQPDWERLTGRERRRMIRHYTRSQGPLPMNQIMPVLGVSIALMAIGGGYDHGLGVFAVLTLDALVVILAVLKK
jgi:hypothetical protein